MKIELVSIILYILTPWILINSDGTRNYKFVPSRGVLLFLMLLLLLLVVVVVLFLQNLIEN